MRLIPVLDILNAQVVHGKKGERDKYAPVQSVLTSSVNPLEVAQAFKTNFPITELYIADLDAILTKKFQCSYLEAILSKTNLQIMIDAGIQNLPVAENLIKRGVHKIIIGTETLPSPTFLQLLIENIPPERLIVSLDLKEGRILSPTKLLRTKTPLEAIRFFETLSIQEVIVLELTRVGSETGVLTPTLRNIIETTSLSIITGGGVRNIQDLLLLKELGVAGALVATALHKGSITPVELMQLVNNFGFY
ncbi:MAG: HisA/HisF-related TIM barrel protein [Candidatus Helarchaeota archaeon]